MSKWKKPALFKFKPFNKKQLKVLKWWQSDSPHKDKDGLICNGSVRAGKTIGSFRRNVFKPLKRMLQSRGYKVKEYRSENMFTVTRNGKVNYFYIFGGRDEASQDLMEEQLRMAQVNIIQQIEVFYSRYAIDNKISYAEAKKYLTAKELKDFRNVTLQQSKALSVSGNPEYDRILEAIGYRARHLERSNESQERTANALEGIHSSLSTLEGRVDRIEKHTYNKESA